MKRIIPEIYVDNCKEALEYYKETFGGEIKTVKGLMKNHESFKMNYKQLGLQFIYY